MVNETWLTSKQSYILENTQYSMIRKDDPTDKPARGVAIVFKRGIQVDTNILPLHLQFPNITILKILLKQAGKHLFLMSFYCPPKNEAKTLCHLGLILEYLSNKYQKWNLVAYSDVNIDLRPHQIPKKSAIATVFFSPFSLFNHFLFKILSNIKSKYGLEPVVPKGKDYTREGLDFLKAKSFLDFFFVKLDQVKGEKNPSIVYFLFLNFNI